MNMRVGDVIICVSCHDYHDPTVEDNGYSIPLAEEVWPTVQPFWDQSANGGNGAYVGVTCDTCHLDRVAKHDTENSHNNRLIVTLCANCHTSDTSVIGQPGSGTLASQADVDTLHKSSCAICHDYANYNSTSDYPLDPAVVAQAIEVGTAGTLTDCLTCHDANFDTIHVFIENHNDLVNVGTTSCGNCHSSAPPLIDNTNSKAHSSCSNCHDENYNTISLAAGITFADGGDCTTCHTDPFDTVHPATIDHSALVKVDTTSCGNCHSDPPPLVDPIDPKVHSECANCHDDQGGLIGSAVGSSFASPGNCTTCHTGSFEGLHPADVDHSALVKVGTTSCGNCHSDPPPLVDPVDPKVHSECANCHDDQGGLIGSCLLYTSPSPRDLN